MSVLAHYLEEEGLSTTILSLVRLHSETTRPPRTLFVPFELGRPLGPANNPALQREALEQALGLLVSDEGPSIISDFDPDRDGTEPDESWSAPKTDASGLDMANTADVRQRLHAEIAALTPVYEAAMQARARTSVGISKLSMGEVADHVASFLDGPHDDSPRGNLSAAMVLRFGADDLKAFYMEAASHGGAPSSWQIGNWFWRDTVLGHVLLSLRSAALETEDKRFSIVGGRFLVPRIWLSELGL